MTNSLNLFKFLIFIVPVMGIFLPGNAHADIPNSEREALIEFYKSAGGENWNNHDGWNGEPGTECTWQGVSCDSENTHVTSLSLPQNGLNGTIPASLGNLSSLISLNLTGNKLTGPIPDELENLSNLEILALGNNRLTGEIPEWSEMPNLTGLYLWKNRLEGTIPAALENLSNLEELDLKQNLLKGPVPAELKNLVRLGDAKSDFCCNFLYTQDAELRDFLNDKQIRYDWESCQTCLSDAILGLQSVAGFKSDSFYCLSDISEDDKIGLEDVIIILRMLSE
jgi:hypothetical protein